MTQRLSETQQGFALALTSAVLWGVSGACAQFVFHHKDITIGWMVTVRGARMLDLLERFVTVAMLCVRVFCCISCYSFD